MSSRGIRKPRYPFHVPLSRMRRVLTRMSRIHFHAVAHDTGVTSSFYLFFNCSEIGLQCHAYCTFMETKLNALFSHLAYLLPLPCLVVFIGAGLTFYGKHFWRACSCRCRVCGYSCPTVLDVCIQHERSKNVSNW
jgi:hypothetical protein